LQSKDDKYSGFFIIFAEKLEKRSFYIQKMGKTLHIYNPEHDIALACNLYNFSIPKAAKLTRERFFYIPVQWAADGDYILVDTVEQKNKGNNEYNKVCFVTHEDLSRMSTADLPQKIEPWGWDRLIVSQLSKANKELVPLLPTDEQLQQIRLMSSRQFAAENLLPQLVSADSEHLIGLSTSITNINSSLSFGEGWGEVFKSPWSCSGRGLRFIHNELTDADRKWIEKIIREQGCVMVEPLYDKVLDFAMEFHASNNGVEYCGINVFETQNGKYLGNLGKNEEERMLILQHFVSLELIEQIKRSVIEITSQLFKSSYEGPFGIDMMVVKTADNKTKVHPCVEMNLRRTMGQI